MELPELPKGYTWDQYSIKAPKGVVFVTQLRKKVWGPFSKPVGSPKAEMVLFDSTNFPKTTNWAADEARKLWKDNS